MKRLLLALSLVALTAAAKPAIRLKPTTITLPGDYAVEYPAGPDADAANANCRACHSPSMALNQPPLSREEWHKEVRKMIDTYKAPVPEDQVPAIVNYFASQQGAKR